MANVELDGMPASMGFGVTVGALFRDQALLGPTRPALEDGDGLWTYAKLNNRVNRLADMLASRGVGRGDRVAVLSENRLEYVEVMLAAAKLGALVACQNWRLADAELKHCLTLADPKLIFCSERFAAVFARLDHGVLAHITFGNEYENVLANADAREPPRRRRSRGRPSHHLYVRDDGASQGRRH